MKQRTPARSTKAMPPDVAAWYKQQLAEAKHVRTISDQAPPAIKILPAPTRRLEIELRLLELEGR